MKPSPTLRLVRPWKRYDDGTPFYGMYRTGSKRWSLTTKQANKNFYKGTGSSGVGRWTNRGAYNVNYEKVNTFVVPAMLNSTSLRPYVCPTTTDIRNTYDGYAHGPIDGKLELKKVMEFVKYGAQESPDMLRENNVYERG